MDAKGRGFVDADTVDFNKSAAVLKAALANEIKGREVYIQYARTVKNEAAKKVFGYLANEELTHISDIKQFLESSKDFSGIDVDEITAGDSVARAKKVFGQLIKDMHHAVKPSDDDNKSRDVAMQFEKNGYEYYRKDADTISNEKLKQFLLWLMEQEQSHYMLIRNAFDYINNPESWYPGEERWLLEG